jgi:hypothetical protein
LRIRRRSATRTIFLADFVFGTETSSLTPPGVGTPTGIIGAKPPPGPLAPRRRLPAPWRAALTAVLGTALVALSGHAEEGLAPEPTYRYAGRYEGEWQAPVDVMVLESAAPFGQGVHPRVGALGGHLTLAVGCDGTLTGEVRGETRRPLHLSAVVERDGAPRFLDGTLALGVHAVLHGTLTERRGLVDSGLVEAALAGATRDLPHDLETAETPQPLQAWFADDASGTWTIAQGAPGELAGEWTGARSLALVLGPEGPTLGVQPGGRWRATRTAVALCPWRGMARAVGSLGEAQRQEELLEFRFWPTGDGAVVGEGMGEARLSGGPPGRCGYSGGGPFAVRVTGQERAGRFRLRFEDDDHPQVWLVTTCPTSRHVTVQPALTARFGPVELPAVAGATAEATPLAPPAHGTLEVTIAPESGAAPP